MTIFTAGCTTPFRRVAWALVCASGALFCNAQSPSGAAVPRPPSSAAEVVGHLNSAVDWYHAVKASDAWLVQANDDFYKSSQDELASQVLTNAFAYSQAMIAVVGRNGAPTADKSGGEARAIRLADRAATNSEELADLRRQEADLNQRITAAQPQDRPSLLAQQKLVNARIDLESALGSTLGKAMALVSNVGGAGDPASLAEQISALQRTVPGALDAQGTVLASKATPAVRTISDGLASRAAALISFVRYRHSLDLLVAQTGKLQAETSQLVPKLGSQLRDAVNAGEEAGKDSAAIDDLAQLTQARNRIEGLAAQVKTLSAALIPLQAEGVALERSKSNLLEWKASLATQTDEILRVLFLRALGLAVALIVLVMISELWRRATLKYVHDSRRRRQLLLVRRFATTIVMIFAIVMGFISDFSSLATFAGFITAGIAVALQSIILSVAAYFFLIGRFGVKVGDRVTVSGVTGDVIDIGLVRVFLMELAGTGVDLHPTGRVVVLANSSLFSTTPLYKQLPGTDYAWHEIYLNVPEDADTGSAKTQMLRAVEKVYGGYRTSIEQQHGDLERLLDYKTDLPVPSAHVRLGESGLEVVVRYPASIRNMSEVDERVTQEVLGAIHSDEALKKSVTSIPHIRAAVKS
jgi:small-conductance mechanosensitive channel